MIACTTECVSLATRQFRFMKKKEFNTNKILRGLLILGNLLGFLENDAHSIDLIKNNEHVRIKHLTYIINFVLFY